jgi:hypothetical protein
VNPSETVGMSKPRGIQPGEKNKYNQSLTRRLVYRCIKNVENNLTRHMGVVVSTKYKT